MSSRRTFLSTSLGFLLFPFAAKKEKPPFPELEGMQWFLSTEPRHNKLEEGVKLFTFGNLSFDENEAVRLYNTDPEVDLIFPVGIMKPDKLLPKTPVIVAGEEKAKIGGYSANFRGKKLAIRCFRFVQAFDNWCVEIDFNQ